MPVAIRLSRIGAKHKPFYRVVVVDSREKRDGKFIENIGTYNARESEMVRFDIDRYDEWVKKGAQPSESAKRLYRLFKKRHASTTPSSAAKKSTKSTTKKEATSKKEDNAEAETTHSQAA